MLKSKKGSKAKRAKAAKAKRPRVALKIAISGPPACGKSYLAEELGRVLADAEVEVWVDGRALALRCCAPALKSVLANVARLVDVVEITTTNSEESRC